MKKLLFLMFALGSSLLLSSCEEDPLEGIQPKFELPEVVATDGEVEGDKDMLR